MPLTVKIRSRLRVLRPHQRLPVVHIGRGEAVVPDVKVNGAARSTFVAFHRAEWIIVLSA